MNLARKSRQWSSVATQLVQDLSPQQYHHCWWAVRFHHDSTATAATRWSIRSFSSASTSRAPRVVMHQPRRHQQQQDSKDRWMQTKEEALQLLQQVESNVHPVGRVSVQVRNLLVHLVNLPKHADKGPLAAQLLKVALDDLNELDQSRTNLSKNELRAKLYQLTIEAWLGTAGKVSSREDAWDEAEKLLWEILGSFQKQGKATTINNNPFVSKRLQYNVQNINGAVALILFAFCKGHGKQELSTRTKARIEPILERTNELWTEQEICLVPSSSAVDAILYYHFKLHQADRAHQILQQILHTTNNPFLKPTSHGVSTVISAHAKAGNVEQATEIIKQMLAGSSSTSTTARQSKNNIQTMPRPNVVAFNGLLDAISRRGGQEAGMQAEKVLQWMEDLSIPPNAVSFTTAISAWTKSRHPNAPERAEAILRHCVDLHVTGSRRDVAPNDITFASVIHAWAMSGRADAAERAASVFEVTKKLYAEKNLAREEMAKISNAVIVAFARSQASIDEVGKFLSNLEELGIPSDSRTPNIVMDALKNSGSVGAQKAWDFFLDLEQKHLAGDSSVVLTAYSYNVALDALSKCDRDSAPAQALDLLQRMMDHGEVEPTTITFNTVMKIIARSNMEDAALRCEHLLNEMEGPGSEKPNTTSYSTCISAWGYARSPDRHDRMLQLLRRMEASYAAGNADAQPNTVPFNTVFIGCLCGDDGRTNALRCVLETLDHLRRTPGVQPNQYTYPLVIRAIGLNTKPGSVQRDSLLKREFENCAKDGFVCQEVLETLQMASPIFWETHIAPLGIIGEGRIVVDRIPNEWRRNLTKN